MTEALLDVLAYAVVGFILGCMVSMGLVGMSYDGLYDDPSDGGTCHAE